MPYGGAFVYFYKKSNTYTEECFIDTGVNQTVKLQQIFELQETNGTVLN
jgi:hypothetical protein